MLSGVLASERIIVGAYTDGRGGVCPMLAAHRAGARTDFLSFARAWDRFARSRGASRSATDREVGILLTQLAPAWRRPTASSSTVRSPSTAVFSLPPPAAERACAPLSTIPPARYGPAVYPSRAVAVRVGRCERPSASPRESRPSPER